MKKSVLIACAVVAVAAIAGGAWYFLGQKPKAPAGVSATQKERRTEEKKETVIKDRPIAEAIKATAGQEDATLGSLDAAGASVAVPKGSFSTSTDISLVTPEKIPALDDSDGELLGAPIEISANGPVRLDEGSTITFRLPADRIPTSTEAFRLRIAYYDGERWDYVRPDAIDLAKGTITLSAYHFSTYAPASAKDGKVTNDWIKAKVLQDALNKDLAKPSDVYSAHALDLSMEKLGIDDVESKNKVLKAMLDDPEYKQMQTYYKTDSQVFDDKLKTLIGKKIVGQVPISIIKNTLKAMKVTGATAAASKALGNIVEGNYTDGAKEIGDFITNQFVLGVAAKAAVAITNYEIRTWKNSEVEAAFKAYRDGSSGYFYGYNNDAKDFDAVWEQMRGIRRQIELEAIRQTNAVRKESGMESLSEAQEEAMRNSLKEQYRSQFATRLERENQLAEQEKKMIRIIDGLRAGGILDSTTGPVGLDKGFDLETKLDVLGHFVDKMMKDTNRFDLTDKIGLVADKAISVEDLVQGARIYFSGPNGKKEYAKFLKDRFNIVLYPTLKELEGNWKNGQMTITDVILSDEAKKMVEEAKNGKKSEDGCDFNMDFSQLKGKSNPLAISMKANDETSGTLSIKGDDGKTVDVPIKYDQGAITGSFTQDEALVTLDMDATKNDSGLSLGGGMVMDYKGLLKLTMSVSANR